MGLVIKSIEVHPVHIPLERPFVHASKSRAHTASVLVAVEVGGRHGWGEGAPRAYVTGETVQIAVEALRRIEPESLNRLIDFDDFETSVCDLARIDLARLVGGRQPMPAAAAALEIALFDVICRLHDQPGLLALRCVPDVARLLNPVASSVRISFVLDMSQDPAKAVTSLGAETIRSIGHVKLKATKDLDSCIRRVAYVREWFASTTTISIDANGDWDKTLAVRAAQRLRPLGVSWLEEPVAPRDWAAMREIQEIGGVPVMLDESCVDMADLDIAAQLKAADYVNARISKCGGIFPTLALIRRARERGMGVQLGAHVGEVGPLWAAARLVSCSLDSLVAVEAGKQDEWFPIPLTEPRYAVDRRRYVAAPRSGVGIGVVPSNALLEWCSSETKPWENCNDDT